ncbi:YlmC/YmxH family sporulation protein [Nonlabens antarcticus]|uniref:photosystem reaction center subunit H n=1 Tax=Nonlabens antarcticus TaxID=392714 RepID=UPI0018911DFB|nr:photosystem reaction center subunit H [Nonlabens antarcticus]
MSTDKKDKSLYYLEELSDYKVANDDKDVRGWDVKDTDNRVIGKVANLLVNKNTERVVYLDVEMDKSIIEAGYKPYNAKAKDGVHDFINEDGENHVIIPIGMADLNLDNEIVSTNKINHDTFARTKRMKKGTPIRREYETIILDTYTRPEEVIVYPEDEAFYDRQEFKR